MSCDRAGAVVTPQDPIAEDPIPEDPISEDPISQDPIADDPTPADPTPADLVPGEPSRMTWVWRLLRGLVTGIFEGVLRWRVTHEGVEHVPEQGGAVVTWNHHSYTDFLFVALGVVRDRRRIVRILGKAEIWENPVTRWFATQAGAVPVHRTTRGGGRRALDSAVAALRQGDLVMLAPEQTISTSFELLPFATGAARMALAAGVPIVPTAGWGSQRLYTKGRRPRVVTGIPVTVVYGEPLVFPPGTTPEEATARLREATEDLLHHLQETYPDVPAPGDDWWVPRRLGGSAPDHQEVLAAHRRWQEESHPGGAA